MKIRLLITLCCVWCLSDDVFAEGESGLKKGQYPFMAFIYYPDESVVESTGRRFIRGAVLVTPEWLLTSSVGPVMINNTPMGFPRKTLLARVGAVSIDANFTLNEDEDEQEREVVQIVRPYNTSEAKWWRNDITLLKTLLPFNLTATVGTATIRKKTGIFGNTNCFMLVYANAKRLGNWTEDKMLMQMFVDLQTSHEYCGNQFHEEDRMLCATKDAEENKDAAFSPEFCQGNSGGPLICENEVTGLQTYIDNNCKEPYLYQLLAAWDNLITCGIENKCNEEHCANTCRVVHKDDPITAEIRNAVVDSIVNLVTASEVASSVTTQTEEISTFSRVTTEFISEEYETPTHSTVTTELEQRVTEETTTTTSTSTTTTTPAMVPTTITTPATETTRVEETTETKPWPKEKNPDSSKRYNDENEIKPERKTNVEAQRQRVRTVRSAAEVNMSVPISLLFQFVLASLII